MQAEQVGVEFRPLGEEWSTLPPSLEERGRRAEFGGKRCNFLFFF